MKNVIFRLLVVFFILPLSFFIFTLSTVWHSNNEKINNSPKTTAVVENILQLNSGGSTYSVRMLGEGTSTEQTVDAKSKSIWNVYDYGETITISQQSDQLLITEAINQIGLLSVLVILVGWWGLLFSIVLFSKMTFLGRISLALITLGFGIVTCCLTHFNYEEKKLFEANSDQIMGTLVDYAHKICETSGGENRKKEKYDCYSMIVDYKPSSSEVLLTLVDKTYRKNKTHAIGSEIEVAYLKSSPKVARIQKNISHSGKIYFLGFFSLILFGVTFLFIWQALSGLSHME